MNFVNKIPHIEFSFMQFPLCYLKRSCNALNENKKKSIYACTYGKLLHLQFILHKVSFKLEKKVQWKSILPKSKSINRILSGFPDKM